MFPPLFLFVPLVEIFFHYACEVYNKNSYRLSSPPRGSYISMRIALSTSIRGNLAFSSPPRGSYISIILCINRKRKKKRTSSRPLHGVLIFQLEFTLVQRLRKRFSSPPRGSYISILSLTPLQTQGFHPPFAGQTRK